MGKEGFLDYAKGNEEIELARLDGNASKYRERCDFYGTVPIDKILYDEGLIDAPNLDELKQSALEDKKVLKLCSIEKLAKAIKSRLKPGEEMNGKISYEVGPDVQGGYCGVDLFYSFPNLFAKDTAPSDSEEEAHEKSLEKGFSNLSHYLNKENLTATQKTQKGNTLEVVVKEA